MERPQGLQASAEDRRTALKAASINAESLEEITVFISEAAANDSVGPDALQAIKAKIKAINDSARNGQPFNPFQMEKIKSTAASAMITKIIGIGKRGANDRL